MLIRINNEKIAKPFNSFEIKRKRIVIEISFLRLRFKINILVLKTIKYYVEDDVVLEELKKLRLIFKEIKVTNKTYVFGINKVLI